jgi:L-ascorbate metabolism protein UlaG (beta-lactamase superfamily)
LKKTGAMLVANPEICNYFAGKGADKSKMNQGNTGGTVDCDRFTTTFVHALHSSSYAEGVYMGNPLGLVLHFPDDKTLYHMGDTDIFSDMGLINELHEPKIGLVPIGDRFTMGGAVAALACRRYFHFETVVPCHYKTFSLLDQTPDKFVRGMEGSGVKVLIPEIGKAADLGLAAQRTAA